MPNLILGGGGGSPSVVDSRNRIQSQACAHIKDESRPYQSGTGPQWPDQVLLAVTVYRPSLFIPVPTWFLVVRFAEVTEGLEFSLFSFIYWK